MKYNSYMKKDVIKNYFPVPNDIFNIDLHAGEIAVYAFLLKCEDRKTYQCYPSYKTIGKALNIKSVNTVSKYVRGLEDKCLIYTEPTEVILKNGKKQNGNLRYTIRPIQDAKDYYYQKQLKNIEEKAKRVKAQKMIEKFKKKHPKAIA